MKFVTLSLYDPATGLFTGRCVSASEADARKMVPKHLAAVEGRYDHKSQRISLDTGAVTDYVPQKPSDTDMFVHVWDGDSKRWEPLPTQLAIDREHDAALIESMKSDEAATLRALREAVLALSSVPTPALDQLKDLDARMIEKRSKLKQK